MILLLVQLVVQQDLQPWDLQSQRYLLPAVAAMVAAGT